MNDIRKYISEVETANQYANVDIRSTDRIHISNSEEINFSTITQKVNYKPKGLWYGFGMSWINWVESEMPGWAYPNVFRIDVNESNILKLKTKEDVLKFHEEYKAPLSSDSYYMKSTKQWNYNIDWGKVSKKYYGIEINPYQWSLRLDLIWYYGWDVASGCVWNVSGIEDIIKLN